MNSKTRIFGRLFHLVPATDPRKSTEGFYTAQEEVATQS
jgi:hypothetical protein